MIEELKSWIITICTAVIFITAAEMILPNNSFKKYVKFVLGLILITVLINPIVRIFDKNYNIDDYTSKAFKYFDEGTYTENIEKYKKDSRSKTLNAFKLNLENECKNKLKEKFPESNYKVEAYVDYEDETSAVIIESIKVWVMEGGINRIKKVDISTKSNIDNSLAILKDERSKLLKGYLSQELKISSNLIEIYKN